MSLRWCVLPLALLAIGLVGCGGGTGPNTFELKGKVTYDGKPVPMGTVSLSPDTGNQGPGASAGVKDGEFTTEDGRGHVGGAYKILVTGYDGVPVEGGEGPDPNGTQLFAPYEMTVDLPKANHEMTIEVPK